MINEHYFLHHGGQPIYSEQQHYYIMAGICDITTRIKICSKKYEETTYQEMPSETVRKMRQNCTQIQKQILDIGAKPIICTIYPVEIQCWNSTRKAQNKTKFLSHSDSYSHMQTSLNEAVLRVNEDIIALNKIARVSTPMLHRCMLHNHTGAKKTWKFQKLVDGCHPTPMLNRTIAASIKRSIILNREKTA